MATVKMTKAANRERAAQVYERLHEAHPDAGCSLDYETPLDLLVATILAAQCTDERVNMVTKDLFRKYRTAQDYVNVPQEELQQDVKTCGFFRNKAKSIKRACQDIVERFGGEVPRTMEELLTLEGVGRKTANVIIAECFGVQAVIVDTHCTRLSQRLGFTKQKDAGKIEQDLMKLVDPAVWTQFTHSLVFHGRRVCNARAPKCSHCVVRELCPFPDTKAGMRIAK